MTADHLGTVSGAPDLLLPGYGFGLGFAVRLQAGISPVPGSVGQYFWGGLAGTTFWVDPAERAVRDHAHPGAGPARLLPHLVPAIWFTRHSMTEQRVPPLLRAPAPPARATTPRSTGIHVRE